MNKNSKQRQSSLRKQLKRSGFPTPVFKRKAKPFPRIPGAPSFTMREQSLMFHGQNSLHAK